MKIIQKYLWLIPGAYVAFMFGDKIVEGLQHSEEFQSIISVIKPLSPYAYTLTPFVGVLDFVIAILFIIAPFIFKSKCKTFFFFWAMIWPFIPASIRYFGGVADFEIVEVLSITVAALISYLLWKNYNK